MPTKKELHDALSDLELAVIGLGIPDLVERWAEPRHRPELGVKLPTNAGTVYRVYDAYLAANKLINE